MSYYAHSCTSDCAIPVEYIPHLIAGYNEYQDRTGGPHTKDVYEVFSRFGFVLEPMYCIRNNNGVENNLTFWFEHNNWHSEDAEDLFNIIAPFVKPGSYISFQGEDDNMWAYYFDGTSWEEYYGITCFPGMPSELPNRVLDAGSSIESNLAVIFGTDLASQIPQEIIEAIRSFKTPSVLEAIAHTLFDVITRKVAPPSPLQEGLLRSLIMEDHA